MVTFIFIGFDFYLTPTFAIEYSRKQAGGVHALGNIADPTLKLCPSLEARIADLRRDNTATAQFLTMAQVSTGCTREHTATRPRGVVG